ncbi:MAG: hypothetical protein AAF684_08855 [Pseudomonadota bacterium]
MTLRPLLLIALCAVVAACGPRSYAVAPTDVSYRPGMVRAFEDGKIPLFLVGGGDGDAQTIADALSGWRNGALLTFTPDGDTGASYGFRVVVRVEGGPGRIQTMCAIGAPAVEGEGAAPSHANFAFCRGQKPITSVVAPLGEGASPDLATAARAALVTLFPRQVEGRSSDGDGDLFFF